MDISSLQIRIWVWKTSDSLKMGSCKPNDDNHHPEASDSSTHQKNSGKEEKSVYAYSHSHLPPKSVVPKPILMVSLCLYLSNGKGYLESPTHRNALMPANGTDCH
jgi:hypothetical protein